MTKAESLVLICKLFTPHFRFLTVGEQLQWNPALRTAIYNTQFHLSQRKVHTFSLELIRLLQTPVNTDNKHFFCFLSHKLLYISTPLYRH